MIEARDFDTAEVDEIHQYIAANVPYTVLSGLFILTENLNDKAKAFCIIYRIVNGAKNYVEDQKTRLKLESLLLECKPAYELLFKLISDSENSTVSYGMHMNKHKMKLLFNDYEKNFMVNKLIDAFLIFAEKLVLLETNKVVGLELDTEEGRDVYKKLNSGDVNSPSILNDK